jgi:hypothetical protein
MMGFLDVTGFLTAFSPSHDGECGVTTYGLVPMNFFFFFFFFSLLTLIPVLSTL